MVDAGRERSWTGARDRRVRLTPLAACLFVVLGAAAVVVAWWARNVVADPPRNGAERLEAGARLCGLLGSYLCVVQVLGAARLPWPERGVPVNVLRRWHACGGAAVVLLLLGHAILAVAAEAATSQAPFVGAAIGITVHAPYLWLAVVGLALFVASGLVSIRQVRAHLRYGWWHLVHLTTYAAILAAFAHQFYGLDLRGHPARLAWVGLHVGAACALVWFRFLRPVTSSLRHRVRVAAVETEAPGVVSVWVVGHRLDELGAAAGQYLRWRILARGLWLRSHPFSLSAVPGPDRLRFTVKAVGDYTSALQALVPGARLLISGPYGALTERVRRRRKVLLLGGGVGIAPLRALLEDLDAEPGELTLVYRATRPADVIFRDEIDALARRRGAAVHYMLGPVDSTGCDPLTSEQLAALVPELADHDVYLCGPPGMTTAAASSLRAAGLDPRHIHSESFAF